MDIDELCIGEETDALVYEIVYGAKPPKYDSKDWTPLWSRNSGHSTVTHWVRKYPGEIIVASPEEFKQLSEWTIGGTQAPPPPEYSGIEAAAMRLFKHESDRSGCGEISYMSESNRAVFRHGPWGCQFGVRAETVWADYMCLCICKAALKRRSRIAAKS